MEISCWEGLIMPDARGYSKRQPAFTDTDKMPFGKFKDELLQDVPASYLKWLYESMKDEVEEISKMWDNKTGVPQFYWTKLNLYNYCHNSIDAILMELGEKRR